MLLVYLLFDLIFVYRTYLPICLYTYLLTYLNTYLPTYLSISLSLSLSLYLYLSIYLTIQGATPSCRRPPRTRRPRGHEATKLRAWSILLKPGASWGLLGAGWGASWAPGPMGASWGLLDLLGTFWGPALEADFQPKNSLKCYIFNGFGDGPGTPQNLSGRLRRGKSSAFLAWGGGTTTSLLAY